MLRRMAKKAKAAPKLSLDVKLRTSAAREKALDVLGAWFVDAVAATIDDEARCRAVLRTAITRFFDVREAAGQERGEYAGHFFLVDAVGLDDSDRPVPGVVLGKSVTPAQYQRLLEWFDAVEREASKPTAAPAAKPPSAPKSKKQAAALDLSLVPTGRVPPPLPPAEGAHAALLAPLHAMEQAFLADSKAALPVHDKALRAIAAGKAPWNGDAAALAEALGLDLGSSPGNPDRTLAKTPADWRRQDKQFERLGEMRFARGQVWALLLALLAKDAKARAAWSKRVAALDDAWWKSWLGPRLA